MSNIIARVLATSAVIALAACAGTQGAGTPQGASSQQALSLGAPSAPLARGASFVHRGVPYMPRRTAHQRARGAVAQTYPTGKVLVYEGDSDSNSVNVYTAKKLTTNPAPLATITDAILCPYGMVLDGSGTLYVANNCGASTITEYPAGSTSHSGEITTGISNPLGLAMDKSGTLYVSNYPATITVYPKGSSSPSETITGGGLTDPFGLALDASGNLYVADFGASQVFEIAAGTTTPVALNLQDIEEPLGVAFDKGGNLWVTDGAGSKVNVYAPGSTTPSQEITAGYSFPYAISIDKKGEAAVSNENNPATVQFYKKGQFTSYATLTNAIEAPTGLLLGKN